MKPGIYFDMPLDDYLADEAMGSGGVKAMLVSPGTFWAVSPMNPKPRKQAPESWARVIGRAYHTARLEPEKFEAEYVRDMVPEDFGDDLIRTGAEIGEALAELGEPKGKAGESVADRAHRLHDAGCGAPIWYVERAKFEVEAAGRTPLSPDVWDQITDDMHRLRENKAVAEVLDAPGFAEVSVFWVGEATGAPMKSRFDWLTAECWADLKTYEGRGGLPALEYCRRDFRMLYYMQAALYAEAAELIRAGKVPVHGSPEQIALVEQIQARTEPLGISYIFIAKNGVPDVWRFDVRTHAMHTSLEAAAPDDEARDEAAAKFGEPCRWYLKARAGIEMAQRQWAEHMEIYGPAQPWAPVWSRAVIDDDAFPGRWLDGDW